MTSKAAAHTARIRSLHQQVSALKNRVKKLTVAVKEQEDEIGDLTHGFVFLYEQTAAFEFEPDMRRFLDELAEKYITDRELAP